MPDSVAVVLMSASTCDDIGLDCLFLCGGGCLWGHAILLPGEMPESEVCQ